MLTVFFLIGDLFTGLSDGLLVLGVRVSMFSFVVSYFCWLDSNCSVISFRMLKFEKKSRLFCKMNHNLPYASENFGTLKC